jgi:2-iminobutanoate/2-iminopropanoate deaminase
MKIIKTKKSPEAIGTYSQGIISSDYVFTSGQIGLDPETGMLIQDNLKDEIFQIFKNLENVLIEGGSNLDSIVKLNIYMIDLGDFDILNSTMSEILNADNLPARSTVEVSRLPKDANIEIDAIGEIL